MNNRIWKWIFRLFAIGAVLIAIGAIVLHLALPSLVRGQVKKVLDQVGLRGATFEVTSASIYGVQISNLRAGEHGELDVSSATLDYAPLRAIGGRIESLAPALRQAGSRVAIVGLGTGTLACYARRGQSWTF